MPPTFPPIAALFLTHFDDLKGQEVAYYRSVSEAALPPKLIEHTTLPSGLHLRDEDVVTFSHHGLPGVGLFRSRPAEGGRGRRMGTLGVVLAPPGAPDALFDLASPLEDIYDRLEGLDNPFARDGEDKAAAAAYLDTVWEQHGAAELGAPVTQSGALLAERLARTSPAHPVTYVPALLGILGPSIVTVYKASLAGQRVLLYGVPPLLPLAAFAWAAWAMGLPPAAAVTAGARPSAWLGNVGLMDLDDVKKRVGGWVATTSDVVFKSHTDAYDVFIDLSKSLPADGSDVRAPQAKAPATPTVLGTSPNPKGGRPVAAALSYSFADLVLYRSLVYLDESPSSVQARAVGFSATSRRGGLWLMVFEVLERIWSLCVGVCEFAIGRGRAGAIALEEDEDTLQHLLSADGRPELDDVAGDDDEAQDLPPLAGDNDAPIADDTARRGRLILGQLRHNTHHLYARLLAVAAGKWELSDADLRELTGASRLSPWSGRGSVDSRFWLALARTWNVEPVAEPVDAADEATRI
ncbi:hypothetical protein Q8F55_002291 [Vanrija albida]|uniref:UDENN domain-containing protein n=1 Tax=Vanrija albida TaxID=181172 RepID=A0ABR3Q9D3_9TREE